MKCGKCVGLLILITSLMLGCNEDWLGTQSTSSKTIAPANVFKFPVQNEYSWCISQSWCELGGTFSHCGAYTYYGWDIYMSGSADIGKPIIASAPGWIKHVDHDGTENSGKWGVNVVIDHGYNICSRYAHMEPGSTSHLTEGQDVDCHGFHIGRLGDTGAPGAFHLHFQFENCSDSKPIEMSFTSVGIPEEGDCLYGDNQLDLNCDGVPDVFNPNNLDEDGWNYVENGHIQNCPMIPSCSRAYDHEFTDHDELLPRTALAAQYLYSECAIDGKQDGSFDPYSRISKAEALKIALFLFGYMEDCGSTETFNDVDQNDWYFPVVVCGLRYGIISSINAYFGPNDDITFEEAARYLAKAAEQANVIEFHGSYLETINYYGGIHGIFQNLQPSFNVLRSDYVEMAAALSPCFCGSVRCAPGYQCDQSNMACSDPDDPDFGMGGGGDDPIVPDDPGFDLNIDMNCFVDEDDCDCIGEDAELLIRCEIENNGDDLNVNDLRLTMIDNIADNYCYVSDDDYRGGVGYTSVDNGETKLISGNFGVICERQPSHGQIFFDVDIYHRDSGVTTVFEEYSIEVDIPQEPFDNCANTCDCTGRECGDDGCGSSCGSCASNEVCSSGQCICVPNCSGRECGNNGCNTGICGTCSSGEICSNGQCICMPECTNKECGPNGCGGVCGACVAGQICNFATGQCVCVPSCSGKQCGSDGCGGSCGTCGTNEACLSNGQCVCIPQCAGKNCGTDGCGGMCGNCATNQVCAVGVCVNSTPSIEHCTNGSDDNLDGLIDCDDPQCFNHMHCPIVICAEMSIYFENGGLLYLSTIDGDEYYLNVPSDTTMTLGIDIPDGLTTVWIYTNSYSASSTVWFDFWSILLPGSAAANPYPWDPPNTSPHHAMHFSISTNSHYWTQFQYICP